MKDKVLAVVNKAKEKIEEDIVRQARYRLEDIYSSKEQAKKILKGLELEEKMFLAELEDQLDD